MATSTKLSRRADPTHRLTVAVGMERLEVRSLPEAVELLRSLRADISGEQAAQLCAQMRSARSPAEVDAAWQAFCRWTGACGLACSNDGDHPVRHAA